jgi:hypothetical protein
MYILGINGGVRSNNQDASACLKIKFANGVLPGNAIRFCLQFANITIHDVSYVVFPGGTIPLKLCGTIYNTSMTDKCDWQDQKSSISLVKEADKSRGDGSRSVARKSERCTLAPCPSAVLVRNQFAGVFAELAKKFWHFSITLYMYVVFALTLSISIFFSPPKSFRFSLPSRI